MLHFFAKLGRKPWTKGVVPALAPIVVGGYLSWHTFGHSLIKNLFTAQSPSGKREEIAEHLQNLIRNVYDDIEEDFHKQYFQDKTESLFETPPLVIKWFSSATMEPITVGMTEFKQGVLIGVPNRYNYCKEDELPVHFLAIEKFKFFRSFGSANRPKSEAGDCEDCDPHEKIRIDKNSPLGRDYISSLVLSDKAKKFSIARELFFSDSYRLFAIAGVLTFTIMGPLIMARSIVSSLKIVDAHLSQRLPFYFFSALFGGFNYKFMSEGVNQYYYQKADELAWTRGEEYREGAVEYYSKIIQRNKALRKIDPDLDSLYNEEGNHRELYSRKHVVYTDQLAKAASLVVNDKEKIKT